MQYWQLSRVTERVREHSNREVRTEICNMQQQLVRTRLLEYNLQCTHVVLEYTYFTHSTQSFLLRNRLELNTIDLQFILHDTTNILKRTNKKTAALHNTITVL